MLKLWWCHCTPLINHRGFTRRLQHSLEKKEENELRKDHAAIRPKLPPTALSFPQWSENPETQRDVLGFQWSLCCWEVLWNSLQFWNAVGWWAKISETCWTDKLREFICMWREEGYPRGWWQKHAPWHPEIPLLWHVLKGNRSLGLYMKKSILIWLTLTLQGGCRGFCRAVCTAQLGNSSAQGNPQAELSTARAPRWSAALPTSGLGSSLLAASLRHYQSLGQL